MISLKPSSKCVVCEELSWGTDTSFLCWRRMCNFSLPPYMPHFLLYLITLPKSKLSTKHVSNYDHVEQFISVLQWAKLWLIKLPNKSVNRLPYRLFTIRWQNNSTLQDICWYRCDCFQHYLVIYFEVNDSYISFYFLSTKHVSNSMIMLYSSSQVLQWAKLWLITNCPINLSTDCPTDYLP